jgi:hypothetical protein
MLQLEQKQQEIHRMSSLASLCRDRNRTNKYLHLTFKRQGDVAFDDYSLLKASDQYVHAAPLANFHEARPAGHM